MGPDPETCDIAILGGGLSGCLIALALAEKRPDLDVRIVEQGERLGGNHFWSFFEADIEPKHRWLVEPLICHRWDGYDVHFPKHSRHFAMPYRTIESARLDEVVRARLPKGRIQLASVLEILPGTGRGTNDASATLVEGSGKVDAAPSVTSSLRSDLPPPRSGEDFCVRLSNETMLTARHVIDARGPGDLSTLSLGWQKFVGLVLHVAGGHGLTRPIVMDATVEQIDGYRFVYCLPFDAETVFVEDTYYSDTPDLDVPAIRERIIAYAAARGWRTNGGGHQESGVLPVAMGGDFEAYWRSSGAGESKAGLRAGLFQATTGYSLPSAVRLAMAIAEDPDMDIHAYAKAHWRSQRFNRLIDTMLFRAAIPKERYRVLERFYTLPEGLIARFYAGQSSTAHRLRILSGKPPVPITSALKAIWDFKWW